MISRDLERAAVSRHDLIIVGAGVHGIALALEAAEAGLRPLLLEAEDFGGGASWNSLRILHGGLRYLQSCDLSRFFESVSERRWYMCRFPELVQKLPCLLPLYGDGARKAEILRAALFINDILSAHRNRGLPVKLKLPRGRILDRKATLELLPLARRENLEGAALWYDAFMPSTERVLIEMLHRACALGATTANYARVENLLVDRGRIAGVRVRDGLSGASFEAHANIVIACLGGAISRFLATQGIEISGVFPPSLAVNVLLDLEPPAQCAVGVSQPTPGGSIYFILPRGRRILAGTSHFARSDSTMMATPSDGEVASFVEELSAALPGMGIRTKHVVRVFAGLLPAMSAGATTLAKRAAVIDHAAHGGPSGLFSVAGIKFTTARSVAARTLNAAFRGLGRVKAHPHAITVECESEPLMLDPEAFMRADTATVHALVRRIVANESVQNADDVVMRRTNWGATASDAALVRARVQASMAARNTEEETRLLEA